MERVLNEENEDVTKQRQKHPRARTGRFPHPGNDSAALGLPRAHEGRGYTTARHGVWQVFAR